MNEHPYIKMIGKESEHERTTENTAGTDQLT